MRLFTLRTARTGASPTRSQAARRLFLLLTTLGVAVASAQPVPPTGGAARAAPAPGPPGLPTAPAPDDTPYLVRAWTTRDGLPVNFVEELARTRDGYLWLATAGGLLRFDGVRFRLYGQADLAPWATTYITMIHADRLGRLVIGSAVGDVGIVEPGGRFRSVMRGSNGAASGAGKNPAELPDGTVWLAAGEGGAVRIDPAGRAVRFAVGPGGLRGATSAMHVDRAGHVYAVTEGGLDRFDGRRFTRVSREASSANGGVERVGDVTWITHNDGTSLRLGASGRPERVALPVRGAKASVILTEPDGGAVVFADAGVVRRTPSGRLDLIEPASALRATSDTWAASGTGVAVWVARDGRSLRLLREGARAPEPLPVPDGVSVIGVNAAVTDAQGTLWVATTGGLLRYAPRRAQGLARAGGLTEPFVFATLAARDGARWVGSWGDGLFRFPPIGGAPQAWGPGEDVPPRIRTLMEDRQGRIWAGGAPTERGEMRGVAVLRGGRVVARINDRATPGLDNGANVIRELRDGTVLFGSRDLHRARDLGGDRFAVMREPWSNGTFWALYEDARGRLYVGGDAGLFVRESDRSPFRRVASVGAVAVKMLHADASGDLWIGTRGAGLVRLRLSQTGGEPHAAPVFVYTRALHGLHHDGIWWIQPDGRAGADGAWWLTSDAGLGRYRAADFDAVMRGDRPRLSPLVLTQADGLPSDEFDSGSPGGMRLADGTLWFPTIAGVAIVDPARVRADTTRPNPVIESVGGDGAMRDTLRPGALVRLAPGTRGLTFGYTALDLTRPEGLRFRVRLDGFDRAWRDMGARREAVYANLPPGRYTFRVRATSADGIASGREAALSVEIEPFWWQTGWAKALAVLLALGALLASWRWRETRMRTVELEAIVRARTAQLCEERDLVERQNAEITAQHERLKTLDRAKANLVANVSHEFRTPLLLMIGGVREVLDRAGDTLAAPLRSHLVTAEHAGERLERLVGHLLDTARVDAGSRPVRAVPGDLAAFVAGVAREFVPLAERAGVTLRIEADAPVGACFDAEAVETILANLIGNAVKFTPPDGRIFVRVTSQAADSSATGEATVAVVRVRDTGKGIAPDALSRIFDRFFQADASSTRAFDGAGLGLALSRELAGLLGGTLAATSDGPGFGSTFSLELPGASPVEIRSAADVLPDVERLRPHLSEMSGLSGPDLDEVERLAQGDGDARHAPDARPCILIVDDNADVRHLVRSQLEAVFRIEEAADGADALVAARRCAPDAVVADVMMPGMDGLALVRALRADAVLAVVPILLLTARGGAAAAEAGLDAGADDYLTKPYAAGELRARVQRLVDGHRARAARFRGEVVLRPGGPPIVSKDAAFVEQARVKVSESMSEASYDAWGLALDMKLSVAQTNRRLKPLTGFATAGFIRELRLLRASDLLTARTGTVRDIARQVGYTDAEHFSRLFRERFGCLPSEWADLQEDRTLTPGE